MIALRDLLGSLDYTEALRLVASANYGAGEPSADMYQEISTPGRQPEMRLRSPETVAVAQTQQLDADGGNWQTLEPFAAQCPACGCGELYERGTVPGSDACVYLECRDCGAWSWPPRSPETAARLSKALGELHEPGDVFRLAALDLRRDPGFEVKWCEECWERLTSTPKATYCAPCAAERKRRPNAKPAFPACCVEHQQRTGTRQRCEQHGDNARSLQADRARQVSTATMAELADAFGAGVGADASERKWAIETGLEPDPYEGRTGSYAAPDLDNDAQAWLKANDHWWREDDSQ